MASRGKPSTGWFYRLKYRLIINELVQIAHFLITLANVSDNNNLVLRKLLSKLTGKRYADKGCISKLFETFY
uniref:transposase n=1 Tax=Spirosoma endbachense TaxID=2666025 RepID=UPI001E3BD939|nr:transposase [Spirosoma endbachense]